MTRINNYSRSELLELQNKRFRKLLKYAVKNSAYYKNLFKELNTETVQLQQLPHSTKKDLMDNFDNLLCDSSINKKHLNKWISDPSNLGKYYLNKYIAMKTSGSTGENALIVYDKPAMDHVHAAIMARHTLKENPDLLKQLSLLTQHFFGKKLKLAIILMTGGPYPAYTAALFEPSFSSMLIKTKVFSLLDSTEKMVAQLNDFQPDSIISYASMLDILGREQIEGRLNIHLTHPLSSVASAGEPLKQTTRALIKKAWNIEIQDTYGASECFLIARNCHSFDLMHVMSDLCILEVVDHNYNPVPDGVLGDKILITNLFNHVMPFIRYEITDVTGISKTDCKCNDWPFPALMPVEGRTDDIIYIDKPDRGSGGYSSLFIHGAHSGT